MSKRQKVINQISNKTFETITELINSQMKILNENGYPIHDAENLEFVISRIRYDKEDGLIKFDTTKENSND